MTGLPIRAAATVIRAQAPAHRRAIAGISNLCPAIGAPCSPLHSRSAHHCRRRRLHHQPGHGMTARARDQKLETVDDAASATCDSTARLPRGPVMVATTATPAAAAQTTDLQQQPQQRLLHTDSGRLPTAHAPPHDVQEGVESWSTTDDEFHNICKQLDEKVSAFLQERHDDAKLRSLQEITRQSLAPLAEALEKYKFEELSFSYNGGKDCLVLLILYLVALHRHYARSNSPIPVSLKSIYIQPAHPFSQVTEFVESSSAYYHICLASSALPMKEAFGQYLDRHPEVKLIFVGTRRTDPHGGQLTFFDMTDGGWPRFMRCHPVIDWHYQDIWTFIRRFEIPYCALYDHGYTSLGGTNDTSPNPALKTAQDGDDDTQYRPAYMLQADSEERLGRDR